MTSAERFLSRLRNLGVSERTALKASAARPHEPDVAAHDAFTGIFWRKPPLNLPRDPCRVVAALYFWHPKDRPKRDPDKDKEADEGGQKAANLGALLGREVNGGRLDPASTGRLVEELLAAPFAGLLGPLLVAVRRLAVARVSIDWPQLIEDLSRWDRPARGKKGTVQHEWAESWIQTGGDRAYRDSRAAKSQPE